MALDLKWISSPNFGYPRSTRGRNGHQVIAIVDHIMDGTLAGTDAWFQNPYSKASAHFGVGKNGEIHQYVGINDAAWHAGDVNQPNWALLKEGVNPNLYTLGIEHEAKTGDAITEAQYQATLALHRWIIDQFGFPINSDTIIGHYRINSVTRASDPGTFMPWERLFADLTVNYTYSDVPHDHWAAGAVDRVTQAGLMSGYADQTFRGDQAVTRFELASVAARILDLIGK